MLSTLLTQLLTRHSLTDLDHWLLLAINHAHTRGLDTLMRYASDRYEWIPMYALLILWLFDIFRGRTWRLLLPLFGAIGLADSITSRLFKPFFGRLRPCHAPDLMAKLHLPDGCGGQFGFLSSHAANSFALAVCLLLVLPAGRYRPLKIGLFVWAGLLSYSRIYLAAHYPSDVLGGALVGTALGVGAAWVFRRWGIPVRPVAGR